MKASAAKAVKKSTRTTVTLPLDDYEELERLADKSKVSVAWMVRDAVQMYLKSKSPLFWQEK